MLYTLLRNVNVYISFYNSTTLGQAIPALVLDATSQNIYYIALFLECFSTYPPSITVDHYFDRHSMAAIFNLWHTKKKDIILVHSHPMAIVVLAVIFFFFFLTKEKSTPLTSQVLHVLTVLVAHWLKIAAQGNKT